MEKMCGRPSCNKPRIKICLACLNEGYCCTECQKSDWKIHWLLCPCLKHGDKLIKNPDLNSLISELLKKTDAHRGKNSDRRLLEYCLLFHERQSGDLRIACEWWVNYMTAVIAYTYCCLITMLLVYYYYYC